MSIRFKAGDVGMAIGTEGDLAKYLQPGLDTVLHFKDTLQSIAGIPNARLRDIPSGSFRAGFSTNQEATWTPGGTNVTFSFRPELTGSATFTKSGSMITYLDGEENAFSMLVPEGHVYVSIALQVSMSVGGGASFSAGQFGVSASLSTDDIFTVANHRCFAADRNVFEALREAFDQFTLPFLLEGVLRLGPDDLLDFQFLGKLGLGFGLNYSVTRAILGGRSAGEIGRSFENKTASGALSAKPTVTAGASFAVRYDHEDAFRFVFRRASDADIVILTILKMDKATLSTALTVGVTVAAGATVNLQAKTEQAIDDAVDQAFTGTAAQALKAKVKAAGNGIVTTLTARATDAVNGLLTKVAGKTGIEVVHERAATDAVLFQLAFDLTTPGVADTAVRLALEGRIAEAALLPGVTLSPGSLIEHAFHERTSFTFQFFDLWKWTDAVEYVNKIDTVYAGNGVLRLIGTEGVTHTSGIVGHEGMCDVYFRATAKQGITTTGIADANLVLCVDLLDQKRGDADATCKLLRLCESDELARATGRAATFMHENHHRLKTSCTFNQGVFKNFTADIYDGDEPPPMPHELDAHNYAAFRDAAAVTMGRWLGFKDYQEWATFNRTATDQDRSTKVPDRRSAGNLQVWPSAFFGITDTAQRQPRRYWSESAREFMNLVDDLGMLCQELDDVRTETCFRHFLESLNGIIKNDVPVEFIKAVLLALVKLANAPAEGVVATTESGTMNIAFRVVSQ